MFTNELKSIFRSSRPTKGVRWTFSRRLFLIGALLTCGVTALFIISPLSEILNPINANPGILETPPAPEPLGFVLPDVSQVPFRKGEELNYKITYKGLTVGHATLSVREGPVIRGRTTLEFISTAKSTSLIDHFFKVRDYNASTVDKKSLYSLQFHQNLHEGRYEAIRNYQFDYIAKTYHSDELHDEKKTEWEGKLEKPVHDVLSAFFITRTGSFQPGESRHISVYRNGKVKEMRVTVGSEEKTVKTPAGSFSCLLVEPDVQGDSIFRGKNGGLRIWMTQDDRRLPVLIQASVTFGHVSVRLNEFQLNDSSERAKK